MEWKTIFLRISPDLIEKIDRQNYLGDRSIFISDLISKQLNEGFSSINNSLNMQTFKEEKNKCFTKHGEVDLVCSNGFSIGRFDINSMDGFKNLIEKIGEISENPDVQLKARNWHMNKI
jgi:hypothetical protein